MEDNQGNGPEEVAGSTMDRIFGMLHSSLAKLTQVTPQQETRLDYGIRELTKGMTPVAVIDKTIFGATGRHQQYFLVEWMELEGAVWVLGNFAKTKFPELIGKFYRNQGWASRPYKKM